jgi:hypothetical protein
MSLHEKNTSYWLKANMAKARDLLPCGMEITSDDLHDGPSQEKGEVMFPMIGPGFV